jgi:hypothetical protein
MHIDWRREDVQALGAWRKTWKRGIKMRRNVVAGNFQVLCLGAVSVELNV